MLSFTYRGLCRCGGCGRILTAEKKVNRYGYRYTYYHCSKNALYSPCGERSIEEGALEEGICKSLAMLVLPKPFAAWIIEGLRRHKDALVLAIAERKDELEGGVRELRRQLDALTDIRLRSLISDEEFLAKRKTLLAGILTSEESLRDPQGPMTCIEPLTKLISFGSSLLSRFEAASNEKRRLIVETVVSNLAVRNRNLIFEAAIPFTLATQSGTTPCQLAEGHDVRTLCPAVNSSRPSHEECAAEATLCPCGDEAREELVAKLIEYSVANRADLERRMELIRRVNEPEVGPQACTSPPSFRSASGWLSVKSMRSLMTQSRRATSRTSASSKGRPNSTSRSPFSSKRSSGRSDDKRSSQRMREA
jgi:hypothetical protein